MEVFLRKAWKVLREGGHLLIADYVMSEGPMQSLDAFGLCLHKAGFEVEVLEDVLPGVMAEGSGCPGGGGYLWGKPHGEKKSLFRHY